MLAWPATTAWRGEGGGRVGKGGGAGGGGGAGAGGPPGTGGGGRRILTADRYRRSEKVGQAGRAVRRRQLGFDGRQAEHPRAVGFDPGDSLGEPAVRRCTRQ